MIGTQNYSFDMRGGQTKERYEKLDKIGEGMKLLFNHSIGTYGVVYKARDT